MQHSAPPLFKQGIPALAKLIVCLVVSLALMVIDFKFKSLDFIRNQVIIIGLHPQSSDYYLATT
ncbi:MAG: hypothetical protein RLZZ325_90 [Pseudomonadota bacterium]